MKNDIETIKRLVGTYDQDSGEFYDAVERMLSFVESKTNTEAQLLQNKLDEQRDKIIAQGAQIVRMNNRSRSDSLKILELLKKIERKDRLLKRSQR
jgi:N-acetylglutamate synthase-like GNAT family acetyltransferase